MSQPNLGTFPTLSTAVKNSTFEAKRNLSTIHDVQGSMSCQNF